MSCGQFSISQRVELENKTYSLYLVGRRGASKELGKEKIDLPQRTQCLSSLNGNSQQAPYANDASTRQYPALSFSISVTEYAFQWRNENCMKNRRAHRAEQEKLNRSGEEEEMELKQEKRSKN